MLQPLAREYLNADFVVKYGTHMDKITNDFNKMTVTLDMKAKP